jgi:RNA polymerase sigma-70 factor, ECF subfamily
MLEHCSPAELLRRTARGDERAFARLHATTISKMRKVAGLTLSNRSELDDVVQEAYLKIWSRARQFNPALASPISWMSAVVRNCAIDLVRSNAVRDAAVKRWVGEASLLADDTPGLDDDIHAQLGPAMQVLSMERQSMLCGAYLQGKSRKALAVEFDAPPSTIKTWLRRSLRVMRDAIDRGQEIER